MRRRDRFSGRAYRGQDVQSAIWLIGLGILFLTGKWWPGILILVGISMVVGTFARGWSVIDASPPPAAPPPPPSPTFRASPAAAEPPAFPAAPAERPKPAAPRTARLPDLCPNCGAPPRTLAQRGENPALCPYCGAEIGSLN